MNAGLRTTGRQEGSTLKPADDIAALLTSRRARITREQAGLPSFGSRRVAGLRPEEVASLAGVSADYYRLLERGQISGASELVLEAIAAPAIVTNAHCDLVAANQLGRALYAPLFESPEPPANGARFVSLDPTAAEFYPDWERLADELVANLRSQAGCERRRFGSRARRSSPAGSCHAGCFRKPKRQLRPRGYLGDGAEEIVGWVAYRERTRNRSEDSLERVVFSSRLRRWLRLVRLPR